MNLHVRIGALIMNLAFGLFGNVIFGLASVLTSYVRMIATGVTTGVDAVAGRLSASAGDNAVQRLAFHSTRLHGIVTFPAAVLVWMLAEPLLDLWLGRRIEEPLTTLPPTVTLVRIFMIGIAVRSISDGWMAILYGAGHIRRYAPAVLVGGVTSPALACLLLLVLPEPLRYTAVCWSFSAVMIVVHGCVIPWIGGKALGIGVAQMFAPLWRSLVLSAACAPVLLLASRGIEEWNLVRLTAGVFIYAALYVALCVIFVMNGAERQRVARAVTRRISRLGVGRAGTP
jgi:O-antigen/teichoic acid export membrane protein